MADFYWHNASLLEGGVDLACHAKSAQLSTEVAPLDTTALCTEGAVELIGGLKSATVNAQLMADFPDPDAALWANLGTSDVVRSFCAGRTVGSVGYAMRGIGVQYQPIGGNVGEVAMSQTTAATSGVLARGRLLHPTSTARTSSGSGTSVEWVEVPAGKSLYAALHVITVSGTTPSLTVKVQSDDNTDFSSATDRVTFSAATVIGAQWGTPAAGAISDTFWRVTWTISGTDPSFAFAVVIGIA